MAHLKNTRPLVVGIGGTTRASSSTENALKLALAGAEQQGATTRLFGGTFLHSLPHYAPENPERSDAQRELVEAVRGADAVIIATPGYHGGISGLVKNALDTLEDLRADERPYLDQRAVGCIVTAYGWQGAGVVLTSLRSIVHALRGWPTPFGATINSLETRFDAEGCSDPKVAAQLAVVGQQATGFAAAFHAQREWDAAQAAAAPVNVANSFQAANAGVSAQNALAGAPASVGVAASAERVREPLSDVVES